MRKLLVLLLALAASKVPAQDSPAVPLDILVYGASGKIGSQVVAEALERGHQVTAVSRNPSQIETTHQNLRVARGDLLDDASIAELATGRDIVVVAVRGIIGEKSAENALQLIAVQRLVAVLRELEGDRPRLMHVGGSGSLEVEPGLLLADRIPKLFIPKGLEAEIAGQVLALEYLRGVSDIEWTYVTPPKNFTNGERTGEYRIGGDSMLEDERGRSRISRADFAVALVDEAENGAFLKARFSVAY